MPLTTRSTARSLLTGLQALSGLALLVAAWDIAVRMSPQTVLPTPWQVVRALWELLLAGRLIEHVVASLFRVTWGYLAAAVVAIPFGLWLGLYRVGEQALATARTAASDFASCSSSGSSVWCSTS